MISTPSQLRALNDLLDDLTADQFRDMITQFWIYSTPMTRGAIKGYRRRIGLPND